MTINLWQNDIKKIQNFKKQNLEGTQQVLPKASAIFGKKCHAI